MFVTIIKIIINNINIIIIIIEASWIRKRGRVLNNLIWIIKTGENSGL